MLSRYKQNLFGKMRQNIHKMFILACSAAIILQCSAAGVNSSSNNRVVMELGEEFAPALPFDQLPIALPSGGGSDRSTKTVTERAKTIPGGTTRLTPPANSGNSSSTSSTRRPSETLKKASSRVVVRPSDRIAKIEEEAEELSSNLGSSLTIADVHGTAGQTRRNAGAPIGVSTHVDAQQQSSRIKPSDRLKLLRSEHGSSSSSSATGGTAIVPYVHSERAPRSLRPSERIQQNMQQIVRYDESGRQIVPAADHPHDQYGNPLPTWNKMAAEGYRNLGHLLMDASAPLVEHALPHVVQGLKATAEIGVKVVTDPRTLQAAKDGAMMSAVKAIATDPRTIEAASNSAKFIGQNVIAPSIRKIGSFAGDSARSLMGGTSQSDSHREE